MGVFDTDREPGNFLFFTEHQGLKGSFKLIPVQYTKVFHSYLVTILSPISGIRKAMGVFMIPAIHLYWLSGAAANWLPASPTTDASSGTLRFKMIKILDEEIKEEHDGLNNRTRMPNEEIKDNNLARKPWISWSGLNPHNPSKSVKAMAISGLWFGSLYTCINQT